MPKKAELTKVQKYYIANNVKEMTCDQMAADLAISPKLVQSYINQLPIAKSKKADFGQSKGAAIMTPNQSMIDDETKVGTNKAFFAEHEKNIHRIRPNDPVQ